MQPSLEKLYKFFKLEAERGFDNRAVVGGLDRILPAWETEARIDNLPESTVTSVINCLRQYPGLEPSTRASSLKELWRTLNKGGRADFPKTRVSPQPSPKGNQPPQNLDSRSPGDTRSNPSPRKPTKNRKIIHPQPNPSTTQGTVPQNEAVAENEKVGLNAPLTVIPGIGPRHAETLQYLGMSNLGDMLYYFPRRYDDYSQLKPIDRLWYGEEVTVIGTVQSINIRPMRGGQVQVIDAMVSDGSGSLRLTWFNQPWIINKLKPGMPIVLSGKIDQYLGRLMMNSPEWEPLDQEQLHTNRIVPVYPLTARITQRWLRRMMHQTVTYWAPRLNDHLPPPVRHSAGLMDLASAIREVHFPSSAEKLKAARERLAFDEIFMLQLGVLNQKNTWKQATAKVFPTSEDWLQAQIAQLPFVLTKAQMHALEEVRDDLASGHPMNRLLQGDVGSGKTVIAALALAMVTNHQSQAAIMAPTSILAEQHYRNLVHLLGRSDDQQGGVVRPDQIRLLIGDTPESEKREIRQGLADGEILIVIGTHALLEAPVLFKQLHLVVVDEQHRFGVEQRSILRSKGENPHLLVMTATPIPRSLALTIYGDLDLTVMDEMPAGRQVIETHVLNPRERERAYSLIKSQVDQGFQAFIIYPLVEQGDRDEAKAAVEEHARLQKAVFPKLNLGLLHGRLKPEEKEAVMTRFRDREYQILISTSVVEVGVDIPNATVMLIEGADRFGLAQLHQFRGRVGRGSEQSFCLLIPENEDDAENDRLMAMVETNDGFILAERDLDQRGPGEFLGTRQSGYSELRMASLTDVRLIEKARDQAQALFNRDPDLSQSDNQLLSQSLRRFWDAGTGDIS